MALAFVIPKTIESTGWIPIFSHTKRYTLTCGECGHAYIDRVSFVQDDARSRCPMCDAVNRWSHNKWLDVWQAAHAAEEQKKLGLVREATLQYLGKKSYRKGRLVTLIGRRTNFYVSIDMVKDTLSGLVAEGKAQRFLFWYKLAPVVENRKVV